jgi:hypothetical protein
VVEAAFKWLAEEIQWGVRYLLTAGFEVVGGWWVASTAPAMLIELAADEGGGGMAARFNGAADTDLEWTPGRGLPWFEV